MASFTDMTAFNDALKELYNDQTVNNMIYKKNPLLAMLPKNEDMGGKYKPIPIVHGGGSGRSSDFATAQSDQSPTNIDAFNITVASDYAVATVTGLTIASAKGAGARAFLDAIKTEIDVKFSLLTNSLAGALFRSGTGTIGKIGSPSASGAGPYQVIVTLDDVDSVVQFERGTFIECRTTEAGAADAVVGFVTAVDRSAGTVTLTNAAAFTGWTTGKFLAVRGDANVKVKGLAAWLPDVAPSASENFFGVDRSVDTRLGGVRYDGSGQSIEEALTRAAALLHREGGDPDICVMSTTSYTGLEVSLGTKVQYCDKVTEAGIGFRGIKLSTPNGYIEVFADRNCTGKHAYMLSLKNWKLESIGQAPHIIKSEDGLEMLRAATSDAFEVRMRYFAQLSCNAPGWSAVVLLAQ